MLEAAIFELFGPGLGFVAAVLAAFGMLIGGLALLCCLAVGGVWLLGYIGRGP